MHIGHKNKAKRGTLLTRGHYGLLVEDGNYIIDLETGPIVQEIFRMSLDRYSVNDICKYLKNKEILTPSYYSHTSTKLNANYLVVNMSGKVTVFMQF